VSSVTLRWFGGGQKVIIGEHVHMVMKLYLIPKVIRTWIPKVICGYCKTFGDLLDMPFVRKVF
jgi:hypothetical protein